jgi:hypothetical protein
MTDEETGFLDFTTQSDKKPGGDVSQPPPFMQFVPTNKPAQQSNLRGETFYSPINDLKLVMVDRHLIITRTPSHRIEFGLAHSLGA